MSIRELESTIRDVESTIREISESARGIESEIENLARTIAEASRTGEHIVENLKSILRTALSSVSEEKSLGETVLTLVEELPSRYIEDLRRAIWELSEDERSRILNAVKRYVEEQIRSGRVRQAVLAAAAGAALAYAAASGGLYRYFKALVDYYNTITTVRNMLHNHRYRTLIRYLEEVTRDTALLKVLEEMYRRCHTPRAWMQVVVAGYGADSYDIIRRARAELDNVLAWTYMATAGSEQWSHIRKVLEHVLGRDLQRLEKESPQVLGLVIGTALSLAASGQRMSLRDLEQYMRDILYLSGTRAGTSMRKLAEAALALARYFQTHRHVLRTVEQYVRRQIATMRNLTAEAT